MLAVINQRAEIVRLLIEAGAKVDLEGSYVDFAYSLLSYAEKHYFHEGAHLTSP